MVDCINQGVIDHNLKLIVIISLKIVLDLANSAYHGEMSHNASLFVKVRI